MKCYTILISNSQKSKLQVLELQDDHYEISLQSLNQSFSVRWNHESGILPGEAWIFPKEKFKEQTFVFWKKFLNSRSHTPICSFLIHQIKSFKMIGVILTLLIQVRSVGQGSRLWPNCFLTNCWFLLSTHSNCLPFDLINEVGFQCLSQKSFASKFVST